MTESDLLARMDALRADARKCRARAVWRNGPTYDYDGPTEKMIELLGILADGPLNLKGIAQAAQSRMNTVNSHLSRMADRGLVDRPARGVYAITDKGRDALAKVAG